MKSNRGLQTDQHAADPLMTAITDELKKPKPQQDWAKIDSQIDELAKKRTLDETAVKILKSRVAMMREDYGDAAKLLLDAEKISPKNVQIARLKLLLASANPKIGPTKALEYWQKVVDQFGDQPVLRLDKADLLINLYKDKQDKQPLKEELASLLTGIDKWTSQQKTELWSNMAGRFINLAMIDEARQCLNLAAENQPNELTLRLALFALALEANDADGMQAAEDKILQIVGDKNDSAWLYAEARRKMWLLRRGQLGKEALPEIRALAKRALEQRKEWHELYSLLAEVELMSNNTPLALKYYDQAEQLGRPTPLIVAQHIRLLSAYGRYAEAGKLLDRIPEFARQTLLGPLYAEILFQTNQVDAALKQARAATEADPKNAQNHYWYSQLLARSSQDPKQSESQRKEILAQAITAMHKAAELQPEFPEAWFALINYYLIQKDPDNAEKTMREAQLALSGDNLTSFLRAATKLCIAGSTRKRCFAKSTKSSPRTCSAPNNWLPFI